MSKNFLKAQLISDIIALIPSLGGLAIILLHVLGFVAVSTMNMIVLIAILITMINILWQEIAEFILKKKYKD